MTGVTSSGLKAVGTTNIQSQPGLIWGVILIPAAAACSAIVYNNNTANASGTELAYASGLANGAHVSVLFNEPVCANKGVTVTIAGSGAQAIVLYSLS